MVTDWARWLARVAAGGLPDWEAIHVLGQNDDVAATALDDLQQVGSVVLPVPASAIAMEVVSTSANDAAAGSGARTVEFVTLGAGFVEQSQTVTLNGTTAVSLTGTHLRLNGMHVLTNGAAGGTAAGDLILQAAGGGTEYARVAAGGNMLLQAHYTVPAGKVGLIVSWSAGMTTRTGRIILRATVNRWTKAVTPGVFHFHDIMTEKNTSMPRAFRLPLVMPAQTDIKVSAQSTGAKGGVATTSVELLLRKTGTTKV